MQLGSPGLPEYAGFVSDALRDLDAVTALAAGTITNLDVDGRRVDVLAVDDLQGSIAPTLRSGSAPTGPGQIALGSLSLEAIDAAVGDAVTVTVGGEDRAVRGGG